MVSTSNHKMKLLTFSSVALVVFWCLGCCLANPRVADGYWERTYLGRPLPCLEGTEVNGGLEGPFKIFIGRFGIGGSTYTVSVYLNTTTNIMVDGLYFRNETVSSVGETEFDVLCSQVTQNLAWQPTHLEKQSLPDKYIAGGIQNNIYQSAICRALSSTAGAHSVTVGWVNLETKVCSFAGPDKAPAKSSVTEILVVI